MDRELKKVGLLAALLLIGACADDSERAHDGALKDGTPQDSTPIGDVGSACKLNIMDSGSTPAVQLSSQSLDCSSRVCIQYPSKGSQPMCTRICDRASDCPGPGKVATCKGGFSCVVAVTIGSLKCCRMCICTAHLIQSLVNKNKAACTGYTPDCPELK